MSASVAITLLFADGGTRRVDANPGDTVVAAAAEAGLHLLTDCSNGQCGTCTAQLVCGSVELGDYDRAVLPDADRADGATLCCVSRVTTQDCVIELPYDLSEATAEEPPPIAGTVSAIERVALETMRLEVRVDAPVTFQPGQYVRLRAAGSEAWRSYSMANASGDSTLVFYVRLVDGGAFSSWLAQSAAVGATLELSEPRGSFFLRHEQARRCSRPRCCSACAAAPTCSRSSGSNSSNNGCRRSRCAWPPRPSPATPAMAAMPPT